MNKKHLVIFLLLTIISIPVKAETTTYPDITEDIEIRYRWYKEIIQDNGKYYPLRKIKEGDKYDKSNYKFVKSTSVNTESCSYPNEFYLIEKRTFKKYKKTYDTKFVVIDNIVPETEIKIYYENQPLNYRIVSHENNSLIIDLNGEKKCDNLLFYINTNNKYKISLYRESNLEQIILSKEIENIKISVPNITWVIDETQYYNTTYIEGNIQTSSLTKEIGSKEMCATYEKYVYKYNVTKEYYDDEYHANIEGYIKDENDYRFYYKGEPIIVTNTIEVTKEKIKEVPKIEYVYIEKETPLENTNPSDNEKECEKEIQTIIKTKIVEKENSKNIKKMYLLIFALVTVIISIIIKEIVKKCKKN